MSDRRIQAYKGKKKKKRLLRIQRIRVLIRNTCFNNPANYSTINDRLINYSLTNLTILIQKIFKFDKK